MKPAFEWKPYHSDNELSAEETIKQNVVLFTLLFSSAINQEYFNFCLQHNNCEYSFRINYTTKEECPSGTFLIQNPDGPQTIFFTLAQTIDSSQPEKNQSLPSESGQANQLMSDIAQLLQICRYTVIDRDLLPQEDDANLSIPQQNNINNITQIMESQKQPDQLPLEKIDVFAVISASDPDDKGRKTLTVLDRWTLSYIQFENSGFTKINDLQLQFLMLPIVLRNPNTSFEQLLCESFNKIQDYINVANPFIFIDFDSETLDALYDTMQKTHQNKRTAGSKPRKTTNITLIFPSQPLVTDVVDVVEQGSILQLSAPEAKQKTGLYNSDALNAMVNAINHALKERKAVKQVTTVLTNIFNTTMPQRRLTKIHPHSDEKKSGGEKAANTLFVP